MSGFERDEIEMCDVNIKDKIRDAFFYIFWDAIFAPISVVPQNAKQREIDGHLIFCGHQISYFVHNTVNHFLIYIFDILHSVCLNNMQSEEPGISLPNIPTDIKRMIIRNSFPAVNELCLVRQLIYFCF